MNHVLQPVIGWLRMDLHDGKPVTPQRAEQAIERMTAACAAERSWLAADHPAMEALARVEALAVGLTPKVPVAPYSFAGGQANAARRLRAAIEGQP